MSIVRPVVANMCEGFAHNFAFDLLHNPPWSSKSSFFTNLLTEVPSSVGGLAELCLVSTAIKPSILLFLEDHKDV